MTKHMGHRRPEDGARNAVMCALGDFTAQMIEDERIGTW